MLKTRILVATLAALLGSSFAHADITIGVSIALTGPTSALGVPTKNGIELWPKSIGGEKLNVIVLDDATDPTVAVKNTRRFITEDKVDIIVGSVATPVAAAMSDVAAEGQTVQLMLSPVNLPEGMGVTGQVLKLVSANPDAVLVVASGSGAASFDLIRVGGADVEGSHAVSGPAGVAGMPRSDATRHGAAPLAAPWWQRPAPACARPSGSSSWTFQLPAS